jgi:hypothetical protein
LDTDVRRAAIVQTGRVLAGADQYTRLVLRCIVRPSPVRAATADPVDEVSIGLIHVARFTTALARLLAHTGTAAEELATDSVLGLDPDRRGEWTLTDAQLVVRGVVPGLSDVRGLLAAVEAVAADREAWGATPVTIVRVRAELAQSDSGGPGARGGVRPSTQERAPVLAGRTLRVARRMLTLAVPVLLALVGSSAHFR